jgi:hypothetical protein
MEAAICGDPELAAYDRAMALIYPRMKPSVRATQRAWLAERDKCGSSKKTKVCLRRSYVDRLLGDWGVPADKHGAPNFSGPIFKRTKSDGPGELILLDVGGGEFVYYLTSTFFSFARDPDHPDEISGDIFGVIRMSDGVGHDIATRLCDFTLKQHGKGWVISDADACLGMNNSPNGTYLPVRRQH